jgi:hypothetical protein
MMAVLSIIRTTNQYGAHMAMALNYDVDKMSGCCAIRVKGNGRPVRETDNLPLLPYEVGGVNSGNDLR